MKKKAIVAGAGIAGLATARALCLKGYDVTVIERGEKAVGASVRNFGMIWPIGQPEGELFEAALRSKTIWKDIADSSGLWYNESGSLHLAYHPDEWEVLEQLHSIFREAGRPVLLSGKTEILCRFPAVNPVGLMGALYSDTEMIVDPRMGIKTIAAYLEEYLGVRFIWGKAVTAVEPGRVFTGAAAHEADVVIICSGADFESLYPELFSTTGMTKCKLQMMRFRSRIPQFDIGTSLCAGLSLIHYSSFRAAPALEALRKRYEAEMPDYIRHGIHVMVSQNDKGELTIGDSHQYGLTHDPFDEVAINQLVLNYLKQFALTGDWELIQTWNGIYPKMTNGASHLFLRADDGIYIFNGLGGAGMTLGFGLAEKCIDLVEGKE